MYTKRASILREGDLFEFSHSTNQKSESHPHSFVFPVRVFAFFILSMSSYRSSILYLTQKSRSRLFNKPSFQYHKEHDVVTISLPSSHTLYLSWLAQWPSFQADDKHYVDRE